MIGDRKPMLGFLTEGRRLLAIAALASMVLVPAYAQARGPDGIAVVAEKVIDAGVNISTTQKVEARGGMPQLPPGSPFEEFFEEFFKNRRGQNGDNNSAPNRERTPRRVSSLGSGFIIDPTG